MSPLTLAQKLIRTVRAVSFDGDITAPFYIGHADTEQLTDDVLRSRHQEYVAENGGMPPTEIEDFEEFLAWLEDRYEYFQIVIAEGMFHV